MAPQQRLTVALCTYNGSRFLPAQLDSFLAQTRQPDELVACDDASTDATVEILRDFARRAPFAVQVVRNERTLGPTKNFEQAIRLSTGELIATSDQDDVWLPEKLATTVAALEATPGAGLAFTDAEVVEEDLRPRRHSMWDAIQFHPSSRRRVRDGRMFEVLLRQWVVTGATMLMRAEHRRHVLPISPSWTHDAWIALLISAMAPVAMLERCTLLYRQHPSQQIGGKKHSLRELYEIARATGRDYFRLNHQRFVEARERLQSLSPWLRDPESLRLIEAKVRHQRRRLDIAESPSRLRKILWAVRELLSGGYQQFTPNPCAHFAKDVLL